MILQISLLAWPNIPQLKLGDIQEYYLSDIPQFLKSTSTAISFRFKINSRWERVSGCCRRREIFFLFIKSHLRIPKRKQKKKTSRSKQGKYVRISGAVWWHYLFQDGNNFLEQRSRKTVSRITKFNRGYSLYIQIQSPNLVLWGKHGRERPHNRKLAATSLTLWKKSDRASAIRLIIQTGDSKGLNLRNEMVWFA